MIVSYQATDCFSNLPIQNSCNSEISEAGYILDRLIISLAGIKLFFITAELRILPIPESYTF